MNQAQIEHILRTHIKVDYDDGYRGFVLKGIEEAVAVLATEAVRHEQKEEAETGMADEQEHELFAAVTKIDIVEAVRDLRDWVHFVSIEKGQRYADLIEAQAKLIAHFVNTRAQGWRNSNWDEAKSAGRILLVWKATAGLSEHVELGKWRGTAWTNTYGKPFSGDPDGWAPLKPFSECTKSSFDPVDTEISSLIRIWRECPAERRPSKSALAERIVQALG